ncbi:hypothetical protein [Paraliobacillus quinghaiensis]|uniref:hypothetical protein n=1 Tax=Paraliobacillus quinghaiensis TaxID=470815 RepID=UPI0013C2ABC2|nr:hypothetical protein [Paraliobacillus quinghaiensis]
MNKKDEQKRIEKAIRSARASMEAEGYQVEEEWVDHIREKAARHSDSTKNGK